MGQSDPIETVTFKHEEGNEGEKNGVKRGIGAFYGGKLLKRQGRREAAPPEFWTPIGRRCTAYQILILADLKQNDRAAPFYRY
jgi:hypothetical protein